MNDLDDEDVQVWRPTARFWFWLWLGTSLAYPAACLILGNVFAGPPMWSVAPIGRRMWSGKLL